MTDLLCVTITIDVISEISGDSQLKLKMRVSLEKIEGTISDLNLSYSTRFTR